MTDKALIMGKGFLVEKAAREYYFSLLPQGNMPTIISGLIENTPEYKAYIQGATWQREQLIKELREAGEIIGGLLGTAKGYELEHRKDKLYTVRQRIERGEQFLAKLDLLKEGE